MPRSRQCPLGAQPVLQNARTRPQGVAADLSQGRPSPWGFGLRSTGRFALRRRRTAIPVVSGLVGGAAGGKDCGAMRRKRLPPKPEPPPEGYVLRRGRSGELEEFPEKMISE